MDLLQNVQTFNCLVYTSINNILMPSPCELMQSKIERTLTMGVTDPKVTVMWKGGEQVYLHVQWQFSVYL